MPEGLILVIKILGSLALFVFGMKTMSEGVQKVVGPGLRKFIANRSSGKLGGVVTGFLTTALVQSSSATSVMVVSFVNAGLLQLRQSISVIMGANIGTTITGWIIVLFGFGALNLSGNSVIVLAFGVPLLFLQKPDWKALGETIIGFGLIFIGISFLQDQLDFLTTTNPTFAHNWLLIGQETGVLTILGFLVAGIIMTVVFQSSSATMALTLCLVAIGLPLELAAAVVLGENVGTTISANIVADAGNVHAKRAARAHLLFNLVGAVGVWICYPWFLDLIRYFIGQFPIPEVGDNPFRDVQWQVCLFHTAFNLVNVVILVWFVDLFAKVVMRMVPSTGEDDEEFALRFMNSSVQTSEMSLVEAQEEISKYGRVIQKMSFHVSAMVVETESKKQSKTLKKVRRLEQLTDDLQEQISDYLSKVGRLELTQQGSGSILAMLSIITDLERAGDIFYVMAKILEGKTESKVYFLPKQRTGIQEMLVLVDQSLEIMIQNLDAGPGELSLDAAQEKEKKINEVRDQLRKKHLKDIESAIYSIQSGMIYLDLFSSLERIGDHIVNVSEALVEEA
jgi:phosphate:Na+ symporter